MTEFQQAVYKYAKENGLLSGDPAKDKKILGRLYWHFGVVSA